MEVLLDKKSVSASFDVKSDKGIKDFYKSVDKASFGAPRDIYNRVVSNSGFSFQPFKPSHPGPGKYGTSDHPYKLIGGKHIKQHQYSMPGRNSKHIFKINSTPGRGSYESNLAAKPVTRISESHLLNPDETLMSRIPNKKVPGPGDYKVDIQFMSHQTSFVDHKKKSKRGNEFSKQSRKVFDASKDENPGPGSYQLSSAFGQYMDAKAYSRMQNTLASISNTTNTSRKNRMLVSKRLRFNSTTMQERNQSQNV